MLKIKDNVELKELEKFGLRYTIDKDENEWLDFPEISGTLDCYFDKSKYLVDEYGLKVDSEDLDALYDLIKDGLVEKVEE